MQGNTSSLLQIPVMPKRRSSSTSDIEEFSSKEKDHVQLRERPSSETDLSAGDKQCVADPKKGRSQTSCVATACFSYYNSSPKQTKQAEHLSQEGMVSPETDVSTKSCSTE